MLKKLSASGKFALASLPAQAYNQFQDEQARQHPPQGMIFLPGIQIVYELERFLIRSNLLTAY
jgi:hypothetical protein